MKKLFYLICLATAVSGCKKQQSPITLTGLSGQWAIFNTYGGLNGHIDSVTLANQCVLKFNADNTFQIYKLGNLAAQGTYEVIKNSISIGGHQYDGIYYNHSKSGSAIRLNADTLNLGVDYNDEIDSAFLKQ